MNIFVLSSIPTVAARMHCDKHVVKQILETAQLLSSAVQIAGDYQDESLYRITHRNHPCSIWARETRSNFCWLVELGMALGEEYTHRYGKTHKSIAVITHAYIRCTKIPDGPLTPFVQCMPDEYKGDGAVAAYRRYYRAEKAHLLTYKNREVPSWI